MIKGWRNDPRWVQYYKQRDEDRAQREIALVKMKHELARSLRERDFSMMKLQRANSY